MYCGFYSKDEMKTIFQFGSYNKASTVYIVHIKILSEGECLAPQPFRVTIYTYILSTIRFSINIRPRDTPWTLGLDYTLN